MALDGILSVTGKPGLYKVKSRTRTGFIATALADGKTTVINATQNVSVLKDIAIYTTSEDKPLDEVFQAIAEKENNGQALSHKSSNDELISYFQQVMPDYDEDRVYASDIKKVVQWYNILQAADLLSETQEESQAQPAKEDEEE